MDTTNRTYPRPDTRRWWEIRVVCPRDAADAVVADIWALGSGGVEERSGSRAGRACTFFKAYFHTTDPRPLQSALEARLKALDAYFPGVSGSRVTVREVEQRDWNEAWKAHFTPQRVTRRIVVRPSWEPYDPSPGQVVVTIDPGMAFGTGTHETTRGCLRMVDALYGGERVEGIEPTCPGAVLDVGTGSGLLLIAALKLGAARGTGIDNDPLAVTAARENCASNAVSDRATIVSTPLERVEGVFELILANILAPVLVDMAPHLASRMTPGATLVLSGLLSNQVDDLVPIFRQYGLERSATLLENAWATVALRRGRP